ncbi:MAG: gliding motility-associated C-terminal domain-containing protein [Bacteroidetes bacterium]|nr:gliding motility-associated C-terminal domain-containing protein [Bacteroidota bacterium]MBP9796287.1 gliding motility-associated C-terminal domain-containing protein [Chitinophagales bacterium]
MRNIYLICICLFVFSNRLHAQTFQLFSEDFDIDYSGSFILNSAGPGDSVGSNQWIINDSYTGGFGYPNTTSESLTESGTIGGAPYSTYMHIYDIEGAPSITCASYDASDASDYFAEMAAGFCTLGLIDIEFTFFYLCEGSPGAYGQVYYSADGGPWTATGAALYNDQTLWKYEVLTDDAFEDVTDLRFGFRWINDNSDGDNKISFAIDDIIAVGTYDAVASPVNITIDFISPDPVCALSTLVLGWSIDGLLCDGTYKVELSNASGSFASAVDLGVFIIPAGDTTGAVAVLIPGSTPEGDCYKIRVNRVSPMPAITGEASVCFEVDNCPNTITTLPAAVTFDSNAVCINSVIDVPFYSTGVFGGTNVYTAQLSDSTGNFDDFSVIGNFTSSATYDPALGSSPGTVSGIVPTVPPGCDYYIRIVSSSPATIGSVYGPICIQECDMETNDITDVYVCISEYIGDTVTINYDVNMFTDTVGYCDTNTFLVEVLDAMFFIQANLGGLGYTVDTESGTINLEIPGYWDLVAMGLDAGVWYLRVIATCADPYENSLGTLIHLSIGAPKDDPPILTPSDTLFCEGAIEFATVSPYNPKSQYQFQFGTGTPFIWPYNPIYINFAGSTGDVTLRVREINFGCPGPWSDYLTFHVIDVPVVSITGPAKVCTGDTITYSVPYFISTYYDWGISGGSIVDTSNNEISVVWDDAGFYTLDIFALNECGSGDGNKTIQVIETIPVNENADQTVCTGTSVALSANTPGISTYTWYIDTLIVWNDFYYGFTADTTTTLFLIATDDEGCASSDTVTIFVEYPTTESDTTEFCIGTQTTLDAGYPGAVYNWNTGESSQLITVINPGIYSVVINPTDMVCDITKTIIANQLIDVCDPIINIPNAFSPNGDGVNDHLVIFGAAIQELDIYIYNRWGELVYASDDLSLLNNSDMGWDGTFNGEPQEMGSYAYVLIVKGGSGKSIQLNGSITLVR